MINLASRDVLHGWGKFVFTGLGLGLLVGLTLSMAGIYRGLVDDGRVLLQNGGGDLWVVQRDTLGPYAEPSNVRDDAYRALLGVKGVAEAGNVTISARLGNLVGATSLTIFSAPPVGNCEDGIDNDADGFVDYPADPGCGGTGTWAKESPQCQDGVDNDGDLAVDFPADASCSDPTDDSESGGSGCGLLGPEPLLVWMALRGRRRRRARP